jgi:hypothetical protein
MPIWLVKDPEYVKLILALFTGATEVDATGVVGIVVALKWAVVNLSEFIVMITGFEEPETAPSQ